MSEKQTGSGHGKRPPINGVLIFKDRRWVRTDGSDPDFEELMRAAVGMADDADDRQEWRYSHCEIESSCGGELALNVRDAVMKRRERMRGTTPPAERPTLITLDPMLERALNAERQLAEACENLEVERERADDAGAKWKQATEALAEARETIAMYQESKSALPEYSSQRELRRQLAERTEERDAFRRERDALLYAISRHLPFIPNMEPIGAAKHAECNVSAWELRKAFLSVKGASHG